MRFVFLLAFAASLPAQVFTFSRDQMLKYTAQNPFERFEDGRPKVPDDVLEKVKGLSAEEIWVVLPGKRYINQYEGNWQILHPGKKLVGRAVTAQFMPMRPDISEAAEAEAKARGVTGRAGNQRVIDMLQPGDVLVVDLFGKIDGGTFVGDNLAYYIMTRKAGLVVDGAIRDLEGIAPMNDLAAYYRGVHPSAINNVMLTGINVPIRVGNATVMPGDVVFGDREGVYFIPPQFVKEIVEKAETTHIHDEWTRMKFAEGKYKSSEIYGSPTDPALRKEYQEYLNKKLGKKE